MSRCRDRTHWTHQTRWDSCGRVIGPSQNFLPHNTQHSQGRDDIHALGGIRTRIPSKRTAADPRPRPRDHWVKYPGSLTFRILAKQIVFQEFSFFKIGILTYWGKKRGLYYWEDVTTEGGREREREMEQER